MAGRLQSDSRGRTGRRASSVRCAEHGWPAGSRSSHADGWTLAVRQSRSHWALGILCALSNCRAADAARATMPVPECLLRGPGACMGALGQIIRPRARHSFDPELLGSCMAPSAPSCPELMLDSGRRATGLTKRRGSPTRGADQREAERCAPPSPWRAVSRSPRKPSNTVWYC